MEDLVYRFLKRIKHRGRTGCVGWPSMMDCSHSMAEEKMVGQTGGFSYTTPAKKDMSSVKMLKAASTRCRTLPNIRAREFLCQTSANVVAHHHSCGKFSPPV
jgi:hypothetical protein